MGRFFFLVFLSPPESVFFVFAKNKIKPAFDSIHPIILHTGVGSCQ